MQKSANQYPEVIDSVELARLAHISTAEVVKDISDTEHEIASYEHEILRRREFVAFLRRILAARHSG